MIPNKIYADTHGRIINTHDTVMAPPPDDSDLYNHEFEGTVVGFDGHYVLVEDGDGNTFSIAPETLEVL